MTSELIIAYSATSISISGSSLCIYCIPKNLLIHILSLL